MNRESKPKQKQKSRNGALSAVLVTLVLFAGLSLLLYPTVADYIHSLNYKKIIENYQQEYLQLDDASRRKMLQDAHAWNKDLTKNASRIGTLNQAQRERYRKLLDPTGTGMMGYVAIESIGVYLPVYHGTEESVLYAGIGHVEGSSLPVGGKGTHTILPGHTGTPSAKLFSDIDQLKAGDTFTLHILGEVLTYRVDSTVVLLPQEAENQAFDPLCDLCTLMTCTPYGVNSHRLLVRGVRIATPDADASGAADPVPAPFPSVLWAVIAGVSVAVVIAVILIVRRRKRRK